MKTDLSIDTSLTVELISNYLKKLVETRQSNGILMGLSGGIDSAVLIAIAVRALGRERVHAEFLYDRDSEESSGEKAEILARWLGIEFIKTDISDAMKDRGVYAPFIMKLVPYSASFNRTIQHCYRLINGETPFMTTLKVGSGLDDGCWIKKLLFALSIQHIDRGFSERHRFRREYLEKRAKRETFTLIGAANRSEFEVGWFVKDGIDDLPIQPMTGLYKTQVWQLAEYLELPASIQNQKPSPDMMVGITDEFGIGHEYRRLDQILDLIERGLDDEAIVGRNIGKDELEDVRQLMTYSAWKRTSAHEIPPVSGAIGGNVRLDA